MVKKKGGGRQNWGVVGDRRESGRKCDFFSPFSFCGGDKMGKGRWKPSLMGEK